MNAPRSWFAVFILALASYVLSYGAALRFAERDANARYFRFSRDPSADRALYLLYFPLNRIWLEYQRRSDDGPCAWDLHVEDRSPFLPSSDE